MNSKILLQFSLICVVLFSSSKLIAQSRKINITDFNVSEQQQKVMVDWKTDGATETNYFAIQKSTDGINYKTIAMVLGPDPKQKNCDCYNCYDKYISKASKQYYRLVHVAADGTEQVSDAKILARP